MARTRPVDLVLSGGGVKGVGLVGAVVALMDAGYRPRRVSGTSAGSIVGAVVAAAQIGKMTSAQVKDLALQLDYSKFLDPGPVERVPFVGPSFALLRGTGIYKGDYARDWVRSQLADLGVHTFGDLAIDDDELPVEQRYRLVVTVADTTTGQLVRLPWDYRRVYGLDPDDQSVADAVRASMSIPFFFQPVELVRIDTGKAATIVDGGMLSNFPVWLFDVQDRDPKRPTFGFRLVGGKGVGGGMQAVVNGLGWPVHLGADMFHTAMEAWDKRFTSHSTYVRTCAVSAGEVGTTDFDLTPTQQDWLVASGRKAAGEFLDQFKLEDYFNTFGRKLEPQPAHV